MGRQPEMVLSETALPPGACANEKAATPQISATAINGSFQGRSIARASLLMSDDMFRAHGDDDPGPEGMGRIAIAANRDNRKCRRQQTASGGALAYGDRD